MNPFLNNEGYPDPTAYHGLKEVIHDEKKVHNLINVLKFIVEWAGFEFIGRIQLKDKKTGREYR